MIEPHIKPDEPGIQPGNVGNGRVLVLNERQQTSITTIATPMAPSTKTKTTLSGFD